MNWLQNLRNNLSLVLGTFWNKINVKSSYLGLFKLANFSIPVVIIYILIIVWLVVSCFLLVVSNLLNYYLLFFISLCKSSPILSIYMVLPRCIRIYFEVFPYLVPKFIIFYVKSLYYYLFFLFVDFVWLLNAFNQVLSSFTGAVCHLPLLLLDLFIYVLTFVFNFFFNIFKWIKSIYYLILYFFVYPIAFYFSSVFKMIMVYYKYKLDILCILSKPIDTTRWIGGFGFTVQFLYKYVALQKLVYNYVVAVFYWIKIIAVPFVVCLGNSHYILLAAPCIILVLSVLASENNYLKVLTVLRNYWFYITFWELLVALSMSKSKNYNGLLDRYKEVEGFLNCYTKTNNFNQTFDDVCFPLSTLDIVNNTDSKISKIVLNSLNNELFYYFTIGVIFSILVTIIFFLCAFLLRNSADPLTICCFLILEYLLLKAFNTQNLLEFYIYFEAVLIPMLVLLLRKGSSGRKIQAAYYLFMYTVVLSLPLLASVGYIQHIYKTLDIVVLKYIIDLNSGMTTLVWFSMFAAFSVKIPIMPFHIWLPEAHVEASTETSIVLASLLLKLGIYGIVCLLIPMLPQYSSYFSPIVNTLAIISLVYSSLFAIKQTDLKKIVAYTSIAHMNFVVLCIFTFSDQGLVAAVYMSFTHGIVSSGLFLLVGCLYDRYHTRDISYFGGLARVNPVLSTFLFMFSISNMSHPGTCSFAGEVLGILSIFESNKYLGILVALSTVLSCIYSISLFSKVCFGELNQTYIHKFTDLNATEFLAISFLLIINIVLGFYPSLLLNLLNPAIILV